MGRPVVAVEDVSTPSIVLEATSREPLGTKEVGWWCPLHVDIGPGSGSGIKTNNDALVSESA